MKVIMLCKSVIASPLLEGKGYYSFTCSYSLFLVKQQCCFDSLPPLVCMLEYP